MYLKNKRTGNITEVTNPDVIRTLAGDKRYILADTIEELTGEAKAEPVQPVDDIEEAPEAPEAAEATEAPEAPEKAEEPVEEAKADYSAMTLKELRAAAKKAGVPGYSNMDKVTLAAVLEMR